LSPMANLEIGAFNISVSMEPQLIAAVPPNMSFAMLPSTAWTNSPPRSLRSASRLVALRS
jgi:hypothetical protein